MLIADRIILQVDNLLKTLTPGVAKATRPSPATQFDEPTLAEDSAKHSTGLMRINHTGEVCAQALYQGQALTAKLPEVRKSMEAAAQEEIDHLAWCEQRIKQLGGNTSLLNPMFYGLSYLLGAGAGLISDKLSLGFVAAVEDQVCLHLKEHLMSIDEQDEKSKAILIQMLEDEEHHAHIALEAGGHEFPSGVKKAMTGISKIMTYSTYRV